MAAHTKLWYFERFRMLDALNDEQRRHLERLTRMLEVKPASNQDLSRISSKLIENSGRTLDWMRLRTW